MKSRTLLLPILAAVVVLAALPAAGESDTVRNLSLSLTADAAEALHLEVPVGEVHVEGTAGQEVEVRVEVQCDRPVKKRCEEAARRIRLTSDNAGDHLRVELDGWPKNKGNDGLSVDVRVEMPARLSLRADLGVGEFESVGLMADVDLDLGVGEATIRGRQEQVRRVNLEVGVGEANLRVGDRHFEGQGFIGRDLKWSQGEGEAAVNVDCGVGEVDVRLDED